MARLRLDHAAASFFRGRLRKTQGTAAPAVHKSRAGASLCLPSSLPVIPITRTKGERSLSGSADLGSVSGC
jgi:hypothetical protein